MQIYSWNMLYRNEEQDRAFEFISRSDFDLFCLQEVPHEFLQRLQTLPHHLSYRVDTERRERGAMVPLYVVTLSKYPITARSEVAFADYWGELPWHTKLFVTLMPERYFTRIRNRGGLVVDVALPTGSVRVYNLHLILAHPMLRLREFEHAMSEHDSARPTIVCGDFNILEKPHITPLNWILGGRITDALLYTREREHIEQRFVAYALTNVLRGRITHPFSLSQLDHILVSHSFSIHNAEVIADRHGSDHHPIHVAVA